MVPSNVAGQPASTEKNEVESMAAVDKTPMRYSEERKEAFLSGTPKQEVSADVGTIDQVSAGGIKSSRLYAMRGKLLYTTVFALFTAWWVVGLVRYRQLGWVIPTLIWLAMALRLITFYVPARLILVPVRKAWNPCAAAVDKLIPDALKAPLGGLLTVAVLVVVSFAPSDVTDHERVDRLLSLVGLGLCVGALWLTSLHRKKIVWYTVIVGILAQCVIALFVLRTSVGYSIFHFVSNLARSFLNYAKVDGMAFLTSDDFVAGSGGYFYLVGVLPAIVFFVAVVQLVMYWGILQWAIRHIGQFFFWLLQVSGAEAAVVAATPFLGQGESAVLIKPFVPYLTRAELHQIMCSGFATVSGSGLAGYIGLGVAPQPLICSCVMSIPASIAISKLRFPETEETITSKAFTWPEQQEDRPINALHAFADGAWLGIKIAGIIGANLLCIISLLGLINGLLTWWGHYFGIHSLTLETILGYVFYPVAFFLGVSRDGDLLKVSRLIGIKVVANEYVAYSYLQSSAEYADLSVRSRLIVTFALCGFGNLGSLGIQIGVLSQLSGRRVADISKVAMSALTVGIISTLSSAIIAGLVLTEETSKKILGL